MTFLKEYFRDRIQVYGSNRYGVFVSIDGVKTDFLYIYEKFAKKEDDFENIRIATLEDIGAMKIQSAASRHSKKDYYDLYELLNVYTFTGLVDFFKKMYPNYDIGGTLKSITNFSEANLEEEPESLKPVRWEIIKEKISTEIKDYVRHLKQEKLAVKLKRQKAIEEIISRKKDKI